ncbi:uncharacterized protein BO88DRAFT_365462 [Aspergillus vadensis CBS 113365]|uniref:Uncharacterized protein n=1 Tax=Aspergillus vadensis (strain CBS 113365 / IMI 142717 / IBT 24658) TaxID=1448311 RepID=A0A319B9B9_ASPVC|nr:hypothetical protein BO88DRAFT_365462 [Aspergillus vadensis CBS 113365]PYH69145.1 hypothetical protein BO88DRAFT_365462 [Aspergillus vadensis CBS 113365]
MRHQPSIIIATCNHPQCVTTQQKILQSDQYIGTAPQIASPDYPRPQDLANNCMNLSFLRTCRQIYHEARHLPYMRTIFFTQQVGTFSNFSFCLRRWQVQSIQYLKICVPSQQGMDTHLAEWNETFSLISLGFPNLAAISIQVYLHFPVQAVRDTFWDGGLLELCRLKRLRGMRLSIFEFDPEWPTTRDPVVFFEYAAGSLPNLLDETTDRNKQLPSHQIPQHICFCDARDKFRDRVQQDTPIGEEWASPDSYHSGQLFFRFAPNTFPLYVRNLIHTLPRRWPHRTHADIRREDHLHRNKTDYAYVYIDSTEHSQSPIFGFQYNPNLRHQHNEKYIAQGLAALRLSRERLRRSVANAPYSRHRQREDGDTGLSSQSSRDRERKEKAFHRGPEIMVPVYQRWTSQIAREHAPSRRAVTSAEDERPGDWRRQLTEEAFAPFIETFPMALR